MSCLAEDDIRKRASACTRAEAVSFGGALDERAQKGGSQANINKRPSSVLDKNCLSQIEFQKSLVDERR